MLRLCLSSRRSRSVGNLSCPTTVPQIVRAWLRLKSTRRKLVESGNIEFASRVKAQRRAHPLEVVTLADIFESHAEAVYFFINRLDGYFSDLLTEIQGRGKDSTLTVEENTSLRSFVTEWQESLASTRLAGFSRTGNSLKAIVVLSDDNRPAPLGKMLQQLQDLRCGLRLDLQANKFLSIPSSHHKYYQKIHLFGPEVFTNFKTTRNDVASAGNCYATGNYTASVFHSVRALEKGLQAFVHYLNDSFNAGINFNKTVEETNWANAIDDIENVVTKKHRRAQLDPRPTTDDVKFCLGAVAEFEYFRSAWRNHIARAQVHYCKSEALLLMNHVGAFMRKISTKLSD